MIDYTGSKIGELTVVRRSPGVRREITWECLCSCGVVINIPTSKIKRGQLSCRACSYKRTTKHGLSGSRVYKIWNCMTQRVSEKSPTKKYYLERGIGVDTRWLKFENFISDMGMPPSDKHTIERVDNSVGYCKGNCIWATMKEQSRNKTSNKKLTYNGETRCMAEWAELFKIEKKTLSCRIKAGWDVSSALTTPSQRKKKRNGKPSS